MTSDVDLRREARGIFDVVLRNVDAGNAVRGALQLEGPHLTIHDTRIDIGAAPKSIYAIAIGKAAWPMAIALDDVLGERIKSGFVVGPHTPEYSSRLIANPKKVVSPWQNCNGAHPLPTESSLIAAQHVFDMLKEANEAHSPVIFLISGGGSSMIEWPRDEQITLADLRMANRALVSCGASISEINAVRRAFSAVKGGRLAMRAPDSDQITLTISDTAKGQESIVASGPTVEPPLDAPEAMDVIERYKLADQLPATILHAIKLPSESPKKTTDVRLRRHYVLLDSDTVLESATDEARRRGFAAQVSADISEQPVAEGVNLILQGVSKLVSESHSPRGVACLVSGGEFSCPVRGDGIGGRNAETALRFAIAMEEARRRGGSPFDTARVSFLSAGTDGIDGNSPAAGAVVSEDTCVRAATLGLDAGDYLKRSDAYSFFDKLGDTIMTGPTGTNVRDVRIVLATLECAALSALSKGG